MTITSSAFERTSVSQDAQRFLAASGLGDEQIVEIHAELLGVLRIERVLDVDERRQPAGFCALAMTVSVSVVLPEIPDRKLRRRARAETADAEREIDQDVAGRNDIDIDDLVVAKAHDRAVAVILGNLLNRQFEILVSRDGEFVFGGFFFGFRGHTESFYYVSGRIAKQKRNAISPRYGRNTKGRNPLRPATFADGICFALRKPRFCAALLAPPSAASS